MRTMTNFEQHYIACALWASVDDEGDPLDREHGSRDLSDEARDKIAADCDAFVERAGDMLDERGEEQAAHDFWLTRNGHGAGFWDGDWPLNGDALTKLAKSFGSCDLYVGDDALIHIC